MTFIVSKDTIESLMGPSIRTQATTPAISPRQSRIRAAGIRSASDTNLVLTNDWPLPQSSECSKVNVPSRISYSRRSSLPNLNQGNPQAHIAYPHQSASLLDPASLHSQPRRRRSRQSMYNSSIDLSSKHSLAPVIENDFSPVEEKSQAQSLNFSHPIYGLFPTEPAADMVGQSGSPAGDESRSEDVGTSSGETSVPPEADHLIELEASSLARKLQALNHNSPLIPSASMSSPELTCSSSLSSSNDEDAASRTSISSASSLDDSTEIPEISSKRLASQSYAGYLADEIARKPKVQSVTVDKTTRLLGPESPKLTSMAVFDLTASVVDCESKHTRATRSDMDTDSATIRKNRPSAFGMFTTKSWTRKNRSSTALA